MITTACACMGAMYGEPYCYCIMQQHGLPLNTEARSIEDARAKKQLAALFGPGGLWYRNPLPTIPANARLLKSRNQREGLYAGKWKGQHFRTKAKWRWFAPPNFDFAQEKWIMRHFLDYRMARNAVATQSRQQP